MKTTPKTKPTVRETECKFRTPYGPRKRVAIAFPAESLYTDQSYGPESDINTIMARYQFNGELPVLNAIPGQFMDTSEMDFKHHMNVVTEAREMFSQLPSSLRSRFGNDPGAFLGFVSDCKNHRELAELGLLTPEATKQILSSPIDSEI